MLKVAPARERGLKLILLLLSINLISRSRKGAWIEILNNKGGVEDNGSRSRKGAWIEMRNRFRFFN